MTSMLCILTEILRLKLRTGHLHYPSDICSLQKGQALYTSTPLTQGRPKINVLSPGDEPADPLADTLPNLQVMFHQQWEYKKPFEYVM